MRGTCRLFMLTGKLIMSRFCLILEPVPLIAKDLATTARENLGFQPLLATSEAEALRLMDSLDAAKRIALAFIHDTAAHFQSSALRPILEARDTEIVLLGPDPRSDWPTGAWPALVWPFSTDQVLELVASLETLAQPPKAC